MKKGHKWITSLFIIFAVFCMAVSNGISAVYVFQQGVDSYTNTVDTYIDSTAATTNYSGATKLGIGLTHKKQALIRFGSIFGSDGGQIPATAEIVSATLCLQTGSTTWDGTSASAVTSLHRLLQAFSDTNTYANSFGGNGVATDDIEAIAAADATIGPNQTIADGQLVSLDVTTALRAWAGSATNHGWLINQTVNDNKWYLYSSEGTTKPKLVVITGGDSDLLVHEPFRTSATSSFSLSYLPGDHPSNTGSDLNGQHPEALGFGAGAWNAHTRFHAKLNGLSYVNGGRLHTSGGAFYTTGTTAYTYDGHRALSSGIVEADLSVVYFSGLIRYPNDSWETSYMNMGFTSSGSTRDLIFGAGRTGSINGNVSDELQHVMRVKGVKTAFGSTFTTDTNNVYLYVVKVEMNASGANERISIFVNPDPSKSEAENASTKLLSNHLADAFNNSSDIDYAVFWTWNIGAMIPECDELRLGKTWESVTPTVTVPGTVCAYDPFLMSTTPSTTKYNLNHPNQWIVGTIDGQSPQTTGFDGTTAWSGTSHYVTDATGLTDPSDNKLLTSGGSVRYGTTSDSTRTQHRALTTAMDANLPVVYVSSLIRYDAALTNNDNYIGMGIASTNTGNTDARALIWGGASVVSTTDIRHGLGVKSGIGNAPGTLFGTSFMTNATTAHLYVLKIEMNAGVDNKEKISIFVNPDLAAGESDNTALLDQYEAEVFYDSSSISHFVLWAWNPGGSNTHYDELRMGVTWDQVAPRVPPPRGTLIIIH